MAVFVGGKPVRDDVLITASESHTGCLGHLHREGWTGRHTTGVWQHHVYATMQLAVTGNSDVGNSKLDRKVGEK